ncbi:hypothetical protein ACISSW_27845, partial [Escherichia coli]
QSSASSLSSGEYLPGSLQGKISSDGCLKKEQMVVSAIASTPQLSFPVSLLALPVAPAIAAVVLAAVSVAIIFSILFPATILSSN